MHEDAQRIVGVERQAHRVFSEDTAGQAKCRMAIRAFCYKVYFKSIL